MKAIAAFRRETAILHRFALIAQAGQGRCILAMF
jgi:hypothetical protein